MRLRLSQITSGFVKDEEGNLHNIGNEKYEAFQELLETIVNEDQRKLIVFYRFNREGERLEHLANSMGITCDRIYGKVVDEERDNIRIAFQEERDPKLLILNTRVGGLGITLTAAREAVFFNIPQGLDQYIQAQDRIHRIGQEHKVTYYHLLGRGSIDEESMKALHTKKDIADIILAHPEVLLLKEHLIDYN